MDKDKVPKADAIKDLKWLLGILAGIWLLWFLTGGPARYEASRGILLKPPSPLSTGETYGKVPDISLKLPDTLNVYLSGNRAVLGTRADLRASKPSAEYFEIVGQSDSPVLITGWKIAGTKAIEAVIPQGVRLLQAGQVSKASDIYLARGERAIIVSGESPVGASFLVNSCSGYLAQFQDFTPKLDNICPSIISDEILKNTPLDSACVSYIDEMPACKTPVSALPKNLSAACREFILTRASYNSCVAHNKNEADFYTGEWRIYLGKDRTLFQSHDTIKFYDKGNNLIGTYSY